MLSYIVRYACIRIPTRQSSVSSISPCSLSGTRTLFSIFSCLLLAPLFRFALGLLNQPIKRFPRFRPTVFPQRQPSFVNPSHPENQPNGRNDHTYDRNTNCHYGKDCLYITFLMPNFDYARRYTVKYGTNNQRPD